MFLYLKILKRIFLEFLLKRLLALFGELDRRLDVSDMLNDLRGCGD
jgi:hypothetical protein